MLFLKKVEVLRFYNKSILMSFRKQKKENYMIAFEESCVLSPFQGEYTKLLNVLSLSFSKSEEKNEDLLVFLKKYDIHKTTEGNPKPCNSQGNPKPCNSQGNPKPCNSQGFVLVFKEILNLVTRKDSYLDHLVFVLSIAQVVKPKFIRSIMSCIVRLKKIQFLYFLLILSTNLSSQN